MIIHVGFPKAASTTMKTLFNEMGYEVPIITQEIIDDRNKFQEFINCMNENSILSSEALVGDVFAGFDNDLNILKVFKESKKRLKVIFVVRNQVDWIKSYYLWCLRSYINCSYNNFFLKFEKDCKYLFFKERNLYINKLDYKKIIDKYKDSFGRENILILTVEELKKYPEIFFKKLSIFCGRKLNEKSKKSILKNERLTISGYYAARIFGFFRLNNQKYYNFIRFLHKKKRNKIFNFLYHFCYFYNRQLNKIIMKINNMSKNKIKIINQKIDNKVFFYFEKKNEELAYEYDLTNEFKEHNYY